MTAHLPTANHSRGIPRATGWPLTRNPGSPANTATTGARSSFSSSPQLWYVARENIVLKVGYSFGVGKPKVL